MNKKKFIALSMSLALLVGCGDVTGSTTTTTQAPADNPLSLPVLNESSFIEEENKKGISLGDFELIFTVDNDTKYGVQLVRSEDQKVASYNKKPASLRVRGKGQGIGVETFQEKFYDEPYDTIKKMAYGYKLTSTITTSHGSEFFIEDAYYVSNEVFGVARSITINVANAEDAGFASIYKMFDGTNGNYFDDFDYFIPSILYKNGENVVSGAIASNLDLDQFSVKETRCGLPMVMARSKASGLSTAIMHLEPEVGIGDAENGGSAGEINNELQYGSIGVQILPQLAINFTYPCTEGPVTYDAGNGIIRRYHEVSEGYVQSYRVGIIGTSEESYNDAMVKSYRNAYTAEERYVADIDMTTIYEQNIEIFTNEYKEYTNGGKVVSAGFPWSLDLPNGTNREGVSFQMGFVGQQIPAAYHLLRTGLATGNAEMTKQGENIVDFWTKDGIMSSYFPTVWWDPSSDSAGGRSRGYPSFLRCMVDGMEGLMDAIRIVSAYGISKPQWTAALSKVANNLVGVQNPDGSFCRAYETNGQVENRNQDSRFQGSSKLNTPIAVRFLAKMYELTNDEKFKNAAVAAAEFCYTELYEKLGKYVGGTPDNPNTVDKEAAVYAMYCFNAAYMLTKDTKFLKAAEHATVCALSWTFVYDWVVPNFTTDDALKNPFSDGGVIGFSIIATGHSGADNYSAYTFYETYKMYLLTGDEFYLEAAKLLQNDTKLSTDYDGKVGYKYRAMMPEATNVSDFKFRSVGSWLPWSGVANIEPIANFEETFGVDDIFEVTATYEEQVALLEAYGIGGRPIVK